ncbi:MAG: LytTR family DNA-binding domain-containing protein [Steroidobacteraceae bacterium]
MTPATAALFYLAAPLLVSVLLGWNRMLVGTHMSRAGSTLFWTGLVGIVWIAAIVGTRLVGALVHRLHWPTWLRAFTGALVGILLFYWPIARYRHFGLGLLPDEFMQLAPPLPWPTFEYLPRLFANTLPGVLYWVVAYAVFEKWLGNRESLPTELPAMAGAGAEATLRARLPAHLDAEIIALKAEDHYVRVYTEKGDTLVHYRFRDAVQDLRGVDGLQVHRSYWVRRASITGRFTKAHNQILRVGDNLSIPISRSFQRALDSSNPVLPADATRAEFERRMQRLG